MAFRSLNPVAEPKAAKTAATAPLQPAATSQPVANTQAPQQEAKLIIETKKPLIIPDQQPSATQKAQAIINTPPAIPKQESSGGKLGSLNSLRKQFIGKPIESAGAPIPLAEMRLQEAWQQFAQQLKENKNPANQSFLMANLIIKDHQNFEVQTNNNLEQKFIEGERRVLSEYLQQIFNNRMLMFTITVNEAAVQSFEPVERTVTLKEKYQHIIDHYPLVKELRDRLNLEVDN